MKQPALQLNERSGEGTEHIVVVYKRAGMAAT